MDETALKELRDAHMRDLIAASARGILIVPSHMVTRPVLMVPQKMYDDLRKYEGEGCNG